MGSWTSDNQLLALMRTYLVASNRVEHAEARADVTLEELQILRRERQEAAVRYEQALIDRGWRIPGLLSGPGDAPTQAAVSF